MVVERCLGSLLFGSRRHTQTLPGRIASIEKRRAARPNRGPPVTLCVIVDWPEVSDAPNTS